MLPAEAPGPSLGGADPAAAWWGGLEAAEGSHACAAAPQLPTGPACLDPRWPDAPHEDGAALYATDDFRIYGFKVAACAKTYAHDFTTCPFAHPGEKALRRDPRSNVYTGIACPDMKKTGLCHRGDRCYACHSVFEYWLHPTRYRTQMCNDGPRCTRRICFFAHSPSELRAGAPKPSLPPDAAAGLAAEAATRTAAAAAAAAAAMRAGGSLPAGLGAGLSTAVPLAYPPPPHRASSDDGSGSSGSGGGCGGHCGCHLHPSPGPPLADAAAPAPRPRARGARGGARARAAAARAAAAAAAAVAAAGAALAGASPPPHQGWGGGGGGGGQWGLPPPHHLHHTHPPSSSSGGWLSPRSPSCGGGPASSLGSLAAFDSLASTADLAAALRSASLGPSASATTATPPRRSAFEGNRGAVAGLPPPSPGGGWAPPYPHAAPWQPHQPPQQWRAHAHAHPDPPGRASADFPAAAEARAVDMGGAAAVAAAAARRRSASMAVPGAAGAAAGVVEEVPPLPPRPPVGGSWHGGEPDDADTATAPVSLRLASLRLQVAMAEEEEARAALDKACRRRAVAAIPPRAPSSPPTTRPAALSLGSLLSTSPVWGPASPPASTGWPAWSERASGTAPAPPVLASTSLEDARRVRAFLAAGGGGAAAPPR